MAVVGKNSKFRGMTGQIDGIILTQDADGRTIGKAKAETVANPQTPAQQAQRTNFKTVTRIAARASQTVSRGWRRIGDELKRVSAVNRFVSYNVVNAKTNNGIDYLKLKFGRGQLKVAEMSNKVFNVAEGLITFDADCVDNSEGISEGNDVCMLIALNVETSQFFVLSVPSRATQVLDIDYVAQDVDKGKWLCVSAFIKLSEYNRHVANGANGGADVVLSALQNYSNSDLQSDFVVEAQFDLA